MPKITKQWHVFVRLSLACPLIIMASACLIHPQHSVDMCSLSNSISEQRWRSSLLTIAILTGNENDVKIIGGQWIDTHKKIVKNLSLDTTFCKGSSIDVVSQLVHNAMDTEKTVEDRVSSAYLVGFLADESAKKASSYVEGELSTVLINILYLFCVLNIAVNILIMYLSEPRSCNSRCLVQ